MHATSIFTVSCSACETEFPVDPAKVPAGGVRARCSVCGAVFRVEHRAPDASGERPVPEATADRVGVASFPEAGPDPDHGPEPWSGVGEEEAPAAEPAVGDTGDDALVGAGETEGVDEEWRVADPGEHPGATVFLESEPESPAIIDEVEAGPADLEGGAEEAAAAPGELPVAEESPAASFWELPTTEAGSAAPAELPDTEEAPAAPAEPAAETSALDRHDGAEPDVDRGAAADGGAGIFAAPPPESPPPAAPGAPSEDRPPLPESFQFGRRDPHEKARRLARVLVSDIITYNPERYLRALESDRLREDFDEEIRKSWTEYVEQVGPDLAQETPYWKDALNDLLARGREVF